MRDFEELKQSIIDTIKANGRGAITGPLLQAELLKICDKMELQSWNGMATPSTQPTRDYHAEHVYMAVEAGDYSAFKDGLVLEEGDFYLLYKMPDEEEWTALDMRKWMKGDKGEDGKDGNVMWPGTGVDEEGYLYAEVPDEEDETNLTIDEESGYLCMEMPDLR